MWRLSVLPSKESRLSPVDVVVEAEADGSVADLAARLGAHLGGDHSRLLLAPTTDGRPWPASRRLADAGLRDGDVLTVSSVTEDWLTRPATSTRPRAVAHVLTGPDAGLQVPVTGDVVTVEVRNGRDGTSRRIVTGDLPTVTAEKYTVLESLELVNVTPAIQAERGIRSEQGVLIFKLAPEVARATGLQEGDVILAINRTPVRTAAQVQELLNVRPGEVIRVYLERDAQITFTDLVFR